MAFCDISGFTAMSERLAKKGRIGAEELTDVLNAVFAPLLERAAEYDGSMLKYGGDAVLVFFTGDGHERRAAAATAAMRKTLRTVGRQRTSAGWVRLRTSVGLHSGEFDFFLVGSTHRELIVAGRAATLTTAMEAAANAGEILMSATTAAALAPSQLGERLGDAALLARAPRVARDTRADTRASGGDASAFVPVALREYLLAGGESPEHRLVTIAFIAFGGLDDALATRGGEATADALQSLIAITSAQFEQHGVTLLATDIYGDGGKLIAVAGAPTSYENNEERMLRAVRAIVDEYDALPLHVGIHRGAVFTGDVGPSFRRTYTMLGDAVNTAARVMANAGVDEIVATPAVLDRSATVFDLDEREPFEAKGKAEPIATYAVGAIAGRRPSIGERLPLVGREAELAALNEMLTRATKGDGNVVELVGEAGIGKTRLLEEFVGNAPARAVIARCEPYQTSTPYFAARQLLLAVLHEEQDLAAAVDNVAPDLRPWLPLLAAVVGAEVPPTPEVERLAPAAFAPKLHAAVIDILAAASASVIVVEDTQWMDAASSGLLGAIAAGAAERSWLVVFTRRPDDDPPFEGEYPKKTITVKPLTTADAATLARAVAPGVLLPAEAARLAERGSGHPLFVQELARETAFTASGAAVPDSVDAVIVSRIDRLSPEARERLRRAAVLGVAFDDWLLRELTGGETAAELAEFLDAEGTRFRFRQALFQQAAYDGLPFRKRRLLHGAVARLLQAAEPERHAEDLSLHMLEAGDFDGAWRYSLVAGHRAMDRHASQDATTFFRRAVSAGRRATSVTKIDLSTAWKDLGRNTFDCGHLEEALDAYSRGRALGKGDDELEVGLCINIAEAHAAMGSLAAGRRWVRRGLRDADAKSGVPARLLTRLLLVAAQMDLRSGLRSSIDLAERALGVARDAGLELEAGHAHAILAVADVVLDAGDGTEHNRIAAAIYAAVGNRHGQGNTLNNLGVVAATHGDWRSAVELYGEAATAHRQAGMELFAASTNANRGELLAEQGHLAEARSVLQDAYETLQASRGYEAFHVRTRLAVVMARLGEADRAEELAAGAVAAFADMAASREVADATNHLAYVRLLRGRAAEAIAALDAVDPSEFDTIAVRAWWLRGVALAQLGIAPDAVACLRRAIAEASLLGRPYDEAVALAALGELEDDVAAAAEAAATFEQLGVIEPMRLPLTA